MESLFTLNFGADYNARHYESKVMRRRFRATG
jgi:hypothetical protein